jgi:hypothetical protein
MELECLSRERLAAGKSLLEAILAGLIDHTGDRFEDGEAALENSEARPPRPRSQPSYGSVEEMEALQVDMLKRFTMNWLDQPSIGGELTPRQAVQSPEGRRKVIEALKQIEYINDQRTRDGESPTMDADYIRKELGLPQAGNKTS